MSKKSVIAVVACLFALCLSLVGCGGSSDDSAKAEARAAFAGTWDLVEMDENGSVTSQEDLEMLKSFGLEVYVNLNEDGTAALVLFGESIDGTWEASSTTAGTITLEDQKVNMTIEDSKLTFEQSGSSLTFEKGEAKEVPAADGSSSAEAESSSSSSAA